VLAKAPTKASTPRRSEKQAYTRLQMSNLLANFRLYSGKLQEAFENKRAGVSDVNMYVSANYGYKPVYLTRSMRIQGACVLAENMFSIGSLPPIGYELNAGGKLVSSLDLGLEIDATTTVAQLSMALITRCDSWEEGDQITCFIGFQTLGVDEMPRSSMKAQKVILSLDNDTPLWNVVSAEGFSTVGGYLASGTALNNMGMAWVHSRNQSSSTKVSTQRLVVVSDILADYQTYAALRAAADSYGGINHKAVYLNPTSSLSEVSSIVVNPAGGNASGGNNGSSGSNSSNGSSGTNGSTETTTVAAPTISGTTPFETSTEVTMTAESGAEIHYTTDGSEPTSASTLYSAAITLSETTTVKAIAVKNGTSSSVASETFTKSGNGSGGSEFD